MSQESHASAAKEAALWTPGSIAQIVSRAIEIFDVHICSDAHPSVVL